LVYNDALLRRFALHRCLLAGKNTHPLNHDQRDDEIEKNGSLSPIYRDYRRLKDLSRQARYEIPNFPVEKKILAKDRLARIKQHLGTDL
jgi:hypothetical protein